MPHSRKKFVLFGSRNFINQFKKMSAVSDKNRNFNFAIIILPSIGTILKSHIL